MESKHRFRAVIQGAGDGGAYVIVTFDVEQAFGKKRVVRSIELLIQGLRTP